MAPASDPSQGGDSKNIIKDALYLFELFRESPQPILINIAPYAAKTGAKPNTIVKHLGQIKKRNNLNIITTTQASSDHNIPQAAPARKQRTEKQDTARKANADEVAAMSQSLPSPPNSAKRDGSMPAPVPQRKRSADSGIWLKEEQEDFQPTKRMKTEEA